MRKLHIRLTSTKVMTVIKRTTNQEEGRQGLTDRQTDRRPNRKIDKLTKGIQLSTNRESKTWKENKSRPIEMYA